MNRNDNTFFFYKKCKILVFVIIMPVRAVLYVYDSNIKLWRGRRNSFGAHYTYFNPTTTAAAATTGLAHEKNITRVDWPTANNARSRTIY